MNSGEQLDGGILTVSTKNRNFMRVSIFLQAAVTFPSVGMHDTAWFNGSSDKRLQTSCGSIRDACHADPSNAATILLRCNSNQRLSQDLARMRLGFFATDVGLIDLNTFAQPIAARPNHRPSQFVQPRPGGQVAAQAQHPLQSHRAGSILLASHIPHGSEPQAQGLACVLKDRPSGDRGLMPTSPTDQSPTSGGPSRASRAARTGKSVQPTKLDEVISTSLLHGESILEFQQSSGVVLSHAGGNLPIVVGGVN